MTREEVEKQLKDFGFSVYALRMNEGELIALNASDDDGINISVFMDQDNTFKLLYSVPKSIARVEIGPCSPFSSDVHVTKMLRQMRRVVMDIKYGSEER